MTTTTKGHTTPETAKELVAVHPQNWAPRLGRIVVQQRGLYERLDQLSRAQSQLIAQDRTDELLGVLGQRQELIDELGRLNEEMAPFVAQWSELSGLLPDQERSLLRESFDEVSRLVTEIGQRDDADRRALESRKAQIGGEIGGIVNARGAMVAYAGPGGSLSPQYQDRQG